MPMPVRRFHGKSKRGCLQCKARHVKCDESQPACGGCLRRNETCQYRYAESQHLDPASSQAAESGCGPVHKSQQQQQHHHHHHHNQQDSSQQQQPAPGLVCGQPGEAAAAAGSFSAIDLVLMHRYATVTSRALFKSTSAQDVWQMEIPLLAESEPLLLHGMLALAALEMTTRAASASLSPADRQRYHIRGLHHQQLGLGMLQKLVDCHSDSQKHITFLFSVILTILGFAQLLLLESSPSLQDILQQFVVCRGAKALKSTRHPGLPATGMLERFIPPQTRQSFVFESASDNAFHTLLRNIDPHPDPAREEAMARLKASWREATEQGNEIRAVSIFPALAPDGYWKQVAAHQPEALQILTQYAAVLAHYRDLWWVGDWDKLIISAVQKVSPATQRSNSVEATSAWYDDKHLNGVLSRTKRSPSD